MLESRVIAVIGEPGEAVVSAGMREPEAEGRAACGGALRTRCWAVD